MKNKILKTGLVVMCGLLFAACASTEKSETPIITEKPKVIIVNPATPTPTITLEQSEIPEEPETPVPTEIVTPKPVETVTLTPTPTVTVTPKPTKKPTTTPVPTKTEQVSYEKGILTEEGFESKWMGLKFIAPEGMEMSSQQELDETMRLMEEALYGALPAGELNYADLATVYEMSAVWQDEGMLLQVIVERLPDESVSAETYVEQLQAEILFLEENNIAYIVDDKIYSEDIGGKEFLNFGYTTNFDEGISLHQENYIKKQGDRIILISVVREDETSDGISKLLDSFIAY